VKLRLARPAPVYYVYLLKSEPDPKQRYIGLTSDLKKRVAGHNRGDSLHTAKFRPWRLHLYFAFAEKKQAISFERYLKTGSGACFRDATFPVGHSRNFTAKASPAPEE
jgi:putative endonuclease